MMTLAERAAGERAASDTMWPQYLSALGTARRARAFATLVRLWAGVLFALTMFLGGACYPPDATKPGAPVITAQPTDQTVAEPHTATFAVTATGTAPLVYQWERLWGAGWVLLDGANGPSYTTPPTTAADSGLKFRVTVLNRVGTAISTSATLTVTTNRPVAPLVTTEPTDQRVNDGQTATFSVAGTGAPTPTFQWQSDVGGTWANLDGATSTTYTTPATAYATDNGTHFRVVLTNSAGSVTSNAALLTVVLTPVGPRIVTEPADQSVVVGQTASFTVVATGVPAPTYLWQRDSGSGFATIVGATSPTYTTAATVLGDSGSRFRVIVSNIVNLTNSTEALLTVSATPAVPSITTQPSDQHVDEGQTATFSVTGTGVPTPTFQWQSDAGGTWANIPGATSATYTTAVTAVADSGKHFRVVLTNSAGSVTSNPAGLTVQPVLVAPHVTTEPADQVVVAGQSASFTVTATGVPAPTYQWQRDSGTGYANIVGATSATYTILATVLGDNGSHFRVVVSNIVNLDQSTAALLTVTPGLSAPTITTPPTPVTVNLGQTATFTVVAAGNPTPTYQWERCAGTVTCSDVVGGTGGTLATYSFVPTTSDSGAYFRVVVTNSQGFVSSDLVLLVVKSTPPP